MGALLTQSWATLTATSGLVGLPPRKEAMTIRIKAELVKGVDLKAGEFFSTAGQEHWDNIPPGAIGEKVYIRTNEPSPPSDKDAEVYRITIEHECPLCGQPISVEVPDVHKQCADREQMLSDQEVAGGD